MSKQQLSQWNFFPSFKKHLTIPLKKTNVVYLLDQIFFEIQVYKHKIDVINYERSVPKDRSDSEQNLKVVKQILTLLLLDHIS